MANQNYEERVADQIAQYAAAEIHYVPPIFHYWSNTYIRPRLNAVLGVDGITDFYVEHIRDRVSPSDPVLHILSIGSGDAELEVQIAQALLSGGLKAFSLECLELSPILIARANDRIRREGVDSWVTMVESDLNSWSPSESPSKKYGAVIANHILHHVVELESLFSSVAMAIGDTGVFLTADMIGRNGHMRWPEALTILNPVWVTLPAACRYNHVFRETDSAFRNWDCSSSGFEGIRAQDILPLLVQRFHFEKFLGFGNLPDTFCSEFYGPNLDPQIPAHTRFIDYLEQLNAIYLELGVLKPTMMFAVMSNRNMGSTRIWKNLSPQFCVRDPENPDLSPARQNSKFLEEAFKPEVVTFRQDAPGRRFLRRGWSHAEAWGTWMVGNEAILELPVPIAEKQRSTLNVRLRASGFVPSRLYSRSFSFMVDGVVIGGVTFCRSEKIPKCFDLEVRNPGSDLFQLRIVAHEQASPAEDGSKDPRFLGLALIDIAVY